MSNTTQDAFLEAFRTLTYTPVEFEYRVYYQPDTRECISKGIDNAPGEYIIVDKDTYESIDFCPNYYVKDGKVLKKQLNFSKQVLLKKVLWERSAYRTMKNNNIYAVDNDDTSFSDAVDYWGVRDWND